MKRRKQLCFEQLGDRRLLSAGPFAELDSPGIDAVGSSVMWSASAIEGRELGHDLIERSSACTPWTPGATFNIQKHPVGSDAGAALVVMSIEHTATGPLSYETGGHTELGYRNTFSGLPDSAMYRPARITPKPFVQGVQPSEVAASAGEEIWPGYDDPVKVQFVWDRGDGSDENSSCWIRVSQFHAGKGFGGIDIPRIAEDVIVDLVQGDPDRPLIVGRVYHAENMPPYGLPGGTNISGMKSNSTNGDGGHVEFVLHDTEGEPLIREHGQFDKDSTIENDLRGHVFHDHRRDVTNNETIEVGADRQRTVGHNETISIGTDRTGRATKDMVLKGKKILQN